VRDDTTEQAAETRCAGRLPGSSRTKSGRLPRPLPHYAESGRLAASRPRRQGTAGRGGPRPGRHRKTGTGRLV